MSVRDIPIRDLDQVFGHLWGEEQYRVEPGVIATQAIGRVFHDGVTRHWSNTRIAAAPGGVVAVIVPFRAGGFIHRVQWVAQGAGVTVDLDFIDLAGAIFSLPGIDASTDGYIDLDLECTEIEITFSAAPAPGEAWAIGEW